MLGSMATAPRSLLFAGVTFAVVACQQRAASPRTDPEPSAVEAAEAAEAEPSAEALATARANEAATALVTTLKGRLTQAMRSGGPSSALEVCAEVGQSLTAKTGEAHDVSVGRSSLRLRNPKNEGPAWVRRWLDKAGEGPVAGAEGFVRTEQTEAGKVVRVLRPIGVEKPCLHCHGDTDALAPEIRDGLAENYPEDRATGYAAGDLRGALWAEAPVDED